MLLCGDRPFRRERFGSRSIGGFRLGLPDRDKDSGHYPRGSIGLSHLSLRLSSDSRSATFTVLSAADNWGIAQDLGRLSRSYRNPFVEIQLSRLLFIVIVRCRATTRLAIMNYGTNYVDGFA